MTLNLPGFPALARAVAGVLIGGVVTAIVFLICVQGSFRQGITDFDYAHVLGTAIEGTAVEESGAEALGVIGDSAGPTALWTTIIACIVLLAFHALVIARLVHRRWVLKGAVLGIVGGLWAGRLLQNQLRGIESTDAISLVTGTLVLVVVALTSNFIPAWRASRVDPAVALRDE